MQYILAAQDNICCSIISCMCAVSEVRLHLSCRGDTGERGGDDKTISGQCCTPCHGMSGTLLFFGVVLFGTEVSSSFLGGGGVLLLVMLDPLWHMVVRVPPYLAVGAHVLAVAVCSCLMQQRSAPPSWCLCFSLAGLVCSRILLIDTLVVHSS